MNFLISTFSHFFETVAKNRTAKELLNMSDSRLKDIGLSRFKLEQGAAGHPWKIEQVAATPSLSIAKSSPKAAQIVVEEKNVEEEKVAA